MLQASHESPVKNASGCGMGDQDLIPRRAKGFLQHVLLTYWVQPASHSIGYVNSSLLVHETHLHDQKHLACVKPFHIPSNCYICPVNCKAVLFAEMLVMITKW